MKGLQGKVAVVTGGSSGIGQAIAIRLGEEGVDVAINYVGRPEGAEETRDVIEHGVNLCMRQLSASGTKPILVAADVSDAGQVDAMFDEVMEQYGGIDILVNNAGLGGKTPLDEADDTRWNAILATNLTAVFRVTREAAPFMAQGASVINLSSVLGRFGVPGYAAYCASKHGVIGLTRALALELAPRQITVNAICPGWVETEMARNGFRSIGKARGGDEEAGRSAAASMAPLGRVLDADEVAGLAVYIASTEAKSLTGQALVLDGGQVMP